MAWRPVSARRDRRGADRPVVLVQVLLGEVRHELVGIDSDEHGADICVDVVVQEPLAQILGNGVFGDLAS